MNSPYISSTNRSMADVVDDEMQIERNAGLVMATNNSSIVSKRSVEKLYLPEPHFFRYFVKKPVRRAPTINRGYWLRMRAVDWVVHQFLEKPSDHGKVIINLGCGYDPLPFQWLAGHPELCTNTKFVDVDYEPLMETKRRIVRETPRMNNLLHHFNPKATGKDKSILIDSEEYAAIGCDLRNLARLERLLRITTDFENCLVLCVAEVSITYMHTDTADALIAWSSALSSDVTFCLLEQCSPDQADNPFTMTMMKHFSKLGTPLRSVQEYPGHHEQIQRFRAAGFTHIDYNNLWQLWSDARFLSPSQRIALDRVEPFDEWEEFALFASHYCLVVAHNRDDPILAERGRSRRDSIASLASDISARTSSPHKPANEWFAFHYSKNPGDLCLRHHGSAYSLPDQDAIAVHGGVGPRSRLNTAAVVRPKHLKCETPVVPPLDMAARCCHTVTSLDNGQNLLVGGRASPIQVFKDCWLQIGDVWKRVHDLPEPRFRHRVVPVTLPDNVTGAICFGGKTDPCHVASDILLWEPAKGWRTLRAAGEDAVPRFGPIFLRLGYNHGLLFGGMRQDGVVCQGLWRWRLHIRNGTVASIVFRSSTALDASIGTMPWFGRFGASFSMQRDEVLIIGGVAKSGCIPKPYEILSIIGCFSNYKEQEAELPLRIGCVTPSRPSDCPRPFLIGHSTHRTKSGTAVTLGGGATCFSFGNYFNNGIWLLYDREYGLSEEWTIVPSRTATTKPPSDDRPSKALPSVPQPALVPDMKIVSQDDFFQAVRRAHPIVLSGLDYGSCTQVWSMDYLRTQVSHDRKITIHNAPNRTMNFQRKDFSYRNVGFHEFLDTLSNPSSHLYLRSLAADNPSASPALFHADWPELSRDFFIPSSLQAIETQLHSSPLRISNDVNMWLHYDVMANVLFQVKGVRKLVLFPPTDLLLLGFHAGSTTSVLDLFVYSDSAATKEFDINAPLGTNPVVVTLRPGMALYIPPLWSHTGVSLPTHCSTTADGTSHMPDSDNAAPGSMKHDDDASNARQPLGGTTARFGDQSENPFINIAINVFFRNMPTSRYAAGRDIYGNRDLACYEDGRKMVEKLADKFKATKSTDAITQESSILLDDIPRDVRKAYLLRLATELEQAAEAL